MRTGLMAALPAVMLLTTGPATAQEAPSRTIVNPTWASIPSGEDMSEAYPGFAIAAGLDGDATLLCVARSDGALDRCEVVETTPSGLGFDRAGLTLSRRFRINPLEVDGTDTKSMVQFTIRFRAEPFTPGPQWMGPEPDPEHVANVRRMLGTMAPVIEQEFAAALEETDVDADRLDKVRTIMVQVRTEFADRDKNAAALAMARLVTPENFERFRSSGAPPPEPTEDAFLRAADQADILMEEATQRRRSLYCAQFDCPVLSAPPADAIRP